MKRSRVAIAILAGLLACGLPLWPVPYSQVSMGTKPSWLVWMLLSAIAGVIAGHLLPRGFALALFSVVGGFVLAVIARAVV